MFTRKKSNFQNPSFKSYAKVFEEPIESKWERIKYSLGVDFYEFFRLEWNNVPSEIQDIFRATVSVESKASEYYGQSEPDKLLFTIRCDECYSIIRDFESGFCISNLYTHLESEHNYPDSHKTWTDRQRQKADKMISNMEYSKANYSNSVFESKADEFSDWGSWSEDQSKMSQRDQISIMKDRGIDDKTLVKMGLKYFLDDHNSQKNGIEGFIDRIEKELGKFGINLDKPEEQEQED
jgi:hypothetical protein